jgi:tetratricopeptide (TPR) repeat protein
MRITRVVVMIAALGSRAIAAPTAEELFAEGQRAYDRRDYAIAIDRWQESYRLSKEPGLLYNIAQAYRLARDCEHALSTYRLFVAVDPASDQLPRADDFIAELEPKCGRPDVVENTPSASISASLAVQPRDDLAQHPTLVFTRRREIAIGVATLSAASLVTAVVFGTTASNKKNEAFALCPDPQTPCADAARAYDLTVSGHRLAIGADVLFGFAGAASIVAGVLWLTGGSESSRRVAVAPTYDGVVIFGRF